MMVAAADISDGYGRPGQSTGCELGYASPGGRWQAPNAAAYGMATRRPIPGGWWGSSLVGGKHDSCGRAEAGTDPVITAGGRAMRVGRATILGIPCHRSWSLCAGSRHNLRRMGGGRAGGGASQVRVITRRTDAGAVPNPIRSSESCTANTGMRPLSIG